VAAAIALTALHAAPDLDATVVAQVTEPAPPRPAGHPDTMFLTSHECLACHNGLTTTTGEDVSIGTSWRGSMMANASRDPYWQAGVRRETIDHPSAAHEIEDECSICHMPMSRTKAKGAGGEGQIFAHLPIGAGQSPDDRLAADGVSCTICHQIGPDRFGTPGSFTGGFVISPPAATGERRMFGPFAVDRGRAAVMRSATGMTPAEASHVRESELCATCHTLYTRALDGGGEAADPFPEQVPYLEWQHSAFRGERSCQSCHMPAVAEPARMASVLGELRDGLGRHSFLGGNFFMLRMLNRFRAELGVEAQPLELEAAARATLRQLQTDTATVAIESATRAGTALQIDVAVANLTGHKLPTGYPSRRAWLHLTVRTDAGQLLFESGAVAPSGALAGNDNDADPARYEPHHDEIRRADEVQIYEAVMTDGAGAVTTGLLRAVRYVKDNRLLPRGFDKATAAPDIAVRGLGAADPDFTGEGDRVRYVVDVAGASSPLLVDVELRYQPISFRWAENLRSYDAVETRRFVGFFDAMAASSSAVLARSAARVP
jgi:hypothetical protein